MRPSWLRALFRGLLAYPWAVLGSAMPLADAGTPPPAELHESFDLQVPVAPTPVRVEGNARLVYELHLTNFAAASLRPTALDVVDPGTGLPVARLEGDALAARMALTGPADEAQLHGAIPAGRRAVLYLELDLPPDAVPAALAHRIAYAREDGTVGTVPGPRVQVERGPLPVLGPPLRGGPWIVIYDAAWPRGHRRVFYAVEGRARLPGRFATDWVLLDDRGRTSRGDGELARDALGYGAEAIAVADATVAAVRNDYPERARVSDNPKHALADASGNHVVLDLGNGRYAFYEHLRPGSVRVAVGERVRRGQVLGELGFTGDSTGPHLHFHVADGPSPVAAEGRPFALERFTVLGRYEDLSRLGNVPWTPRASDRPALRTAERPEGNSVVALGPAEASP